MTTNLHGIPVRHLPSLNEEQWSILDRFMLEPGGIHLRLMPAEYLLAIGIDNLQAWCVRHARYQLVTLELVEWLRARIAGRHAIEVGAGMGDLGYHLGIHMTDSAAQAEPETLFLMGATGQIPTDPPPDVERIDAEVAVTKYEPEVVVASWVTQKWHEGEESNLARGNMFGPEEIRIVRQVGSYIHVGNSAVHGDKRIRKLKHREYRPAGLVSRGTYQDKNVIYVWDRAK